ncbi:hypothetical protein HHK36_001034 [Tetracentron sinense]|uniref:Uncharacterized protein n=1 Tax=Tetracentron sinense TaxID=13715 RepID=A0A835DRP6_TETSI|nr:hypothetical protein HHK36_001034 [Tetracentron sinense]
MLPCFCCYEMLQFEEQLDIAHQIGTTGSQIRSNLNDLSLGTNCLYRGSEPEISSCTLAYCLVMRLGVGIQREERRKLVAFPRVHGIFNDKAKVHHF